MSFDDQQLNRDLLDRLDRDYGFKPSDDGKWLRKGLCPSCGKREMYVAAERPRVIRCARANKCGVEHHVKDIYADLFENWSKRHKATPENPDAAADAYLRDARGFELARIAGWYKQEHYHDTEKGIGSATVRFALAGDAWWERIIDQPARFGDRKATFRGKYAGTWWQPPSLTDIPAELWIVEAIFDAIAWLHHDVAAVAAMSCNNYPGKSLNLFSSVDLPRNAAN